MRWIDKYNKEKEKKRKEKYSNISATLLCSYFIQFAKTKRFWGEYMAFFYKKYIRIGMYYDEEYRKSNLNVFAKNGFIDFVKTKLTFNRFLNEKTLENVFCLPYVIDFNHKMNNLEILNKEFIQFLNSHGYVRYTRITQ